MNNEIIQLRINLRYALFNIGLLLWVIFDFVRDQREINGAIVKSIDLITQAIVLMNR